jgi:hypothetical protein
MNLNIDVNTYGEMVRELHSIEVQPCRRRPPKSYRLSRVFSRRLKLKQAWVSAGKCQSVDPFLRAKDGKHTVRGIGTIGDW